ncbi:MAG TPA: hypothetical protein PKM87_10980 [Methanolinea sp.]|nr:hypothetical protein [Methanolinea sp.]
MSEVILSSLHLVVGKVSSLRGAGWTRQCEVSERERAWPSSGTQDNARSCPTM